MKTAEEMRAYKRAWYAANRSRCRRYSQKYLAKHPEKAAELARRFRDSHPGYNTTPERRAAQRARSQRHKLKKHGLTPEAFETLLRSQNNQCAICSEVLYSPWVYPERRGQRSGPYSCACVDHDHESGKVRAILCRNCNTAIGHFQDSARITFLGASYLQSHGKA